MNRKSGPSGRSALEASPHLNSEGVEVEDQALGVAKIGSRREFIQEFLIQDRPEEVVGH